MKEDRYVAIFRWLFRGKAPREARPQDPPPRAGRTAAEETAALRSELDKITGAKRQHEHGSPPDAQHEHG